MTTPQSSPIPPSHTTNSPFSSSPPPAYPSSESSSYDSEEERVKERLQYMERQRQIHSDAMKTRERLHQQQKQQRTAYHSQAFFNSPSHDRDMRDSEPDVETITLHERQWTTIEESLLVTAAPRLRGTLIPWPPFEHDLRRYLRGLSQYLLLQARGGSGDRDGINHSQPQPVKKAYARACLRWHPDKFQQNYGRFIPSGELDTVMTRVKSIAQGLNEAYGELCSL